YIEQIRGFWRCHEVDVFPTNVIALYFYRDETMKWIGNVWNAFKSAIKLGCLTIANWFQNFVDTIYTAWVCLQNKMGMISDAELARTKARIAEEQRLRLNAIQEAGK